MEDDLTKQQKEFYNQYLKERERVLEKSKLVWELVTMCELFENQLSQTEIRSTKFYLDFLVDVITLLEKKNIIKIK